MKTPQKILFIQCISGTLAPSQGWYKTTVSQLVKWDLELPRNFHHIQLERFGSGIPYWNSPLVSALIVSQPRSGLYKARCCKSRPQHPYNRHNDSLTCYNTHQLCLTYNRHNDSLTCENTHQLCLTYNIHNDSLTCYNNHQFCLTYNRHNEA